MQDEMDLPGLTWSQIYSEFGFYLRRSGCSNDFNFVDVMFLHDPKYPDRGSLRYDSHTCAIWDSDEIEGNWLKVQNSILGFDKDFLWKGVPLRARSAGERRTAEMMALAWDSPEKQAMILLKAHLFECIGGRNFIGRDGYGNGISRNVYKSLISAINSHQNELVGYPISWHSQCSDVITQNRYYDEYTPKINTVREALKYFAWKTLSIMSESKFMRLQFVSEVDETFEFRLEHYKRMESIRETNASREFYSSVLRELSSADNHGCLKDDSPESSQQMVESDVRIHSHATEVTPAITSQPTDSFTESSMPTKARSVTEILLESAALRNRPVSARINEAMRGVDLDELEKMIWTEPMTKVCANFGISNTYLSAYCKENGLRTPTSHFWSDVSRGVIVPNGTVSDDPRHFSMPKILARQSSPTLGV